jgi:hypothetical protein
VASGDHEIDLRRVRYRPGQTLRAGDLRDQVDASAHLRWWHNRAVHLPFGVAEGLDVSEESAPGGNRVAVAQPGLAHDAFGRELVLGAPARVPFPADPAGLTLLLRHPDAGERCRPPGPELAWAKTRTRRAQDGVPLAVTDAAGALSAAARHRPTARPIARPKVATGATVPGATDWKPWAPAAWPARGVAAVLGYQVEVDTSAAGFTRPPRYFAWLQGLRAGPRPLALALVGEHLERESTRGFAYCLWAPVVAMYARVSSSAGPDLFREWVRRNDLYVRWLAVEAPEAPAPEPILV